MICIMRNLLMLLWRLRRPVICHQQAEDPGTSIIQSKSEGLRTRGTDGINPSSKG